MANTTHPLTVAAELSRPFVRHGDRRGFRRAWHGILLGGLGLLALVAALSGNAQLYKYQDEHGFWHYTDRPRSDPQQPGEVLSRPDPANRPTRDLTAQLRERFSPENPLQEATLGTVMIKTALGFGSGFFISNAGHLLTNQHVIRLPESDRATLQQTVGDAQQRIDRQRQNLAWREQEMEKFRRYLAQYEAYLRELPEGAEKTRRQAHYQSQRDQYLTLRRELAAERREFQETERKITTARRQMDWNLAVADAANTFPIILKDGTELRASLLAVSRNHDLALLKVDQHTTPALQPATPADVGHGVPVYAIGNPLGLRDSISAGVISGIEPPFVRTDAKIYPGNSGGPLVLNNGRVVGINTMKRITHQFEGIGYAIDIGTALQEFASALPRD